MSNNQFRITHRKHSPSFNQVYIQRIRLIVLLFNPNQSFKKVVSTVPEKYADQELLLRIRNNDEAAFAALYRRHVKILIATAIRKTGMKSVAEDLVQETFVKLWLRRHSCEIDKNFQAYLHGILRNGIIDYYHQEQKKTLVTLEEIDNPIANDTQEYLNLNGLHEVYELALQKLPPKCRAVFELSRKGYSLREIALEMDISEKTVEAHISKALRILRIEMKDYLVFALLFLPGLH